MNTTVLPRSLTIRTVKEVHQEIMDVITRSESLTLEAHDVEEVDTAGLQLLAALLSSTAAAITLKAPSQELQSAATLAGFTIPEP